MQDTKTVKVVLLGAIFDIGCLMSCLSINPPTSCRFQRFEANEKKITEDYRSTCFSKLYWLKKTFLKNCIFIFSIQFIRQFHK